jgi:hypothetical protein
MTNAWIEHIKQFAKRKGLTYGCSLSDPECKAEYYAKKSPKTSKSAGPSAVDKTISTQVKGKVVIATFQNAYYDNWVITDDGEVLELAKSNRFIVIKDKGSIKDAFDWLMKDRKNDIFLSNYSYNQTTYTKKDEDELKKYGLTLEVPSPNILKIFYANWFPNKDAYTKMIYDEAKVNQN